MAFRPLLRHRVAVPAAFAVTTISLMPQTKVRAETPDLDAIHRKPIYDDLPSSLSPAAIANAPTTPPSTSSTSPSSSSAKRSTSRTPTDRLATEIGAARRFLHTHASRAESTLNSWMTRLLRAERDFTTAIADLAPARETGERLLPNALYVLVAAMAGSILVRRRNIVLRALVPPAVGIGAAYAALPHTTRNVEKLVVSWEEKYPAVRDAHVRMQERVTRFVETGVAHSKMAGAQAEEKIGEVRKAIEDWTKKGL